MSLIWSELRNQLEYFSSPFPKDAIALAHQHRDEIAPFLLDVLHSIAANPKPAENGEYMLHLYAMHLLAAWRDQRAYPAMLALGAFSEDVIDDIMGDVVTETYGRCLASVCDGNVEPLQRRFENPQASIWSRTAALIAWQVCVLGGELPRQPLVDYLLQQGELIAQQRLTQHEGDAILLEVIVETAMSLCASEIAGTVNQWFEAGLLDPQLCDRDWFNEHICCDFQASRLAEMQHGKSFIGDIEKEMGSWISYQEQQDRGYRRTYTQHTIRKEPKIGRNAICPCGSGKKYKRCHGAHI